MTARPSCSATFTLTTLTMLLGALLPASGCSDQTTAGDAAVADARARDGATVDQRAGDVGSGEAHPDGVTKTDGPLTDGAHSDGKATDAHAADSLAPDTRSPDLPQSGCNPTKIGFPQANPQQYEIYEFCFAAGDTFTETQAKALDPGLLCVHNSGGAFAKCPAGRWRCSGILVRGPTGAVLQASWDTLCLISQLPKIDTIVGGHYL